MPLVDAAQALVQGAVGRFLEREIERGLDGEAVLVQLLGAVPRFELLADVFEEIRGGRGGGRGLAPQNNRFGTRGVGLGRCDEPDVRHPRQRVVAAPQRRLHVHVRALPDVALQNAGNQRRFLEGEILGRLAEVEARGRLHPVDAVPEVHLIAVEGEDLVLRVALLDLDGENRFLDLPLPRFLVGEEQLAGELLGERAGAGGHPSFDDVLDERDDDARDAEAEVLLEGGVLGGEDRLLQLRRDRFIRDDLAPLNRELADDLAAGAVDARDGARRIVVQRINLGDVPRVGEEHPARQPEHDGERKQQNDPGAPGNPDDVSGHSRRLELVVARDKGDGTRHSPLSLLPSPLTREASSTPPSPV